jgi:hypothetical protein
MREIIPQSNVYSFPLFTPNANKPENIIPFEKRKYHVFFSGNLNFNRLWLYWGLKKKPKWLSSLFHKLLSIKGGGMLFRFIYGNKTYDFSNCIPNSLIRFNNGFYKGFSPLEYKQLTENSMIVLNPKGFESTECFRMYEAMAAGCVVISEPLPKMSFYKEIPVVFIKDWHEVYKVTEALLSDSDALSILSRNAAIFYQKNLSSEAIAQYIKHIVTND